MSIWSVMILPIILRVYIGVGTEFLPEGYISIKAIGPVIRIHWRVIRKEEGLQLMLAFAGRKTSRTKTMQDMNSNSAAYIRLVMEHKALQKNLLSYFKTFRITGNCRIGAGDAASTALICGAIKSLSGCMKLFQVHVIPEFHQPTFCLDAKCIASFRLGKLLLSAVLCLHAFAMQNLRHKAGGAAHGQSSN